MTRIRKLIDLDKRDVEWFDKNYPRGSYSHVLAALLHEFVVAHARDPLDMMKISAAAVKQSIQQEE